MKQRLQCKVLALAILVAGLTVSAPVMGGSMLRPAPYFSLECLSGDKISLEQHRGRVVVLDFFATWCMPCHKVVPVLKDIQEKYAARDLVVLAVSLDSTMVLSNADLQAYADKHKISYPILRADNQLIDHYFRDSEILLPAVFLIDREGRIVSRNTGRRSELESALKKLFPE